LFVITQFLESVMHKAVWEIWVPTIMNGKPIRTKYHRVWDRKVEEISGGLTVLTPAIGHWISPKGESVVERMIPVRIMCTDEQIITISDLSAKYYNQEAMFYYKISNEVHIRYYPKEQT
jgi:hypothetical protein